MIVLIVSCSQSMLRTGT